MPCYDDRSCWKKPESRREREAKVDEDRLHAGYYVESPNEIRNPERKEQEIASDMAAMLCSACRVLERIGYDFDENPMLSRWWDDHKKKDVDLKAMLAHDK